MILSPRAALGAAVALSAVSVLAADPAPPASSDPRLTVELVAAEPDIVTPTGLTVDFAGRVYVIENHTHHRKADYKGPPADRIKVFSGFAADGKAGKIEVFHEGFRDGMSLQWRPDRPDSSAGSLLLATRSEIRRLRDTDGDGRADRNTLLIKLETKGNYPHNGLAGFAADPAGGFWFGMGENLGAPYTLVGADGTKLTGGGEGGNVYWCDDEGGKLRRVATGFWNPFHLSFDAFGRLWAVDNDPDSRPPCRLLHVVEGGDYGYRFRNGRKGLHPFTSWNGELPGTLPMAAGTAEAPSGILAYESDGLPAEYRGDLLVTSWGDHVVERFRPFARGASYGAKGSVMLKGGGDFRPVGIVQAPDGSLLITDWVDKSYPVHGKGRIWRVRWKDRPADDGVRPEKLDGKDGDALLNLLNHAKAEVRAAAAERLAAAGRLPDALPAANDPRARIAARQALVRQAGLPEAAVARLRDLGIPGAVAEEPLETLRLLGRRGAAEVPDLSDSDAATPALVTQALRLRAGRQSVPSILDRSADADPFVFQAIVFALSQHAEPAAVIEVLGSPAPRRRLAALLALRQRTDGAGREQLPKLLTDPDPAIRRAAIQWVGEDRLKQNAEPLERSVAVTPVTREVFEAYLAARRFLDGVELVGNDTAGEDVVAAFVADPKRPAALRAVALRMLRADHKKLTPAVLDSLTGQGPELDRALVETLALRPDGASQAILRQRLAKAHDPDVIAGLAHSAPSSEDTRKALLTALAKAEPVPGREILRSLRGTKATGEELKVAADFANRAAATDALREELHEQVLRLATGDRIDGFSPAKVRPADDDGWRRALDAAPGDPDAGRRLFFHARGPQCATCHRVQGRGGSAGPDLTTIAASSDRRKLIDSILHPSAEIAPQFTVWAIRRGDDTVTTGVILAEDAGGITLADQKGQLIRIAADDIAERAAQKVSLMPEKLADQMTVQEFRDLLAYLEKLK